MKLLTILFSALFTLLLTAPAFASGGDQNRKAADVSQPDAECVYLLPPGVDGDDCSESQGTATSGLEIFTCPVTVACFPEEEESPGNSGK